MGYTILGYNGVTEIGRRTVEEPRGVSTEVHYEGPVAKITEYYQSLRGLGYYLDCDTLNPPKGKLTVRTPDFGDGAGGEGIIQTQFDLVTNALQRSPMEHPNAIALGSATLDLISQSIDDNAKDAALTGDSGEIYDAMRLDQNFICSTYVFKMTQYFVNDTIIDIVFADVNKVYTSAALIAEANPTALYQSAINEAYSTYLVSTYSSSIPANHTFGWLKQAPQIQTVSGNRSALSVEWWLEAWRDVFYA